MPNRFQTKRTSTSGRTPNTTNSGNAQYIAAGEFGLNMTDKILYTSDGTNLIEVGANVTNQRITNSLSIDNNKSIRFQTVNTSAYVGMRQQNDDNFVFYSTNTAYGERAIFAVFANSVNSAFETLAPVKLTGGVIANNSFGSAGQTLTSSGSGVYWATAAGSGTVTQVNTGNGLTGGPVTSTGTVSVLANTGIVANATGLYVNATYIGTLSANNTSFLGGTAAASFVQNTDSRTMSGNLVISGTYFNPSANTILLGNSIQRWVLSANSGDFSSTVNAVTSVNSALLTVGTSFIANTTGAYHTGVVNAASHTVGTSTIANSTGVYTGVVNAASHTVGSSFIANSTAIVGTGFANITTSVNSALLTVGTSFIANTTGAYHTGVVNGASHTVGSSFIANSTAIVGTGYANVTTSVNSAAHTVGTAFIANATGVYHTGVVNAASHTVGSTFIANTTQLTITVPVSANGSTGIAGYVLTSNGSTGSPYWAVATSAFAAKTANYTAVNGDRLLCDTSGGSFTITLPATPSLGHTVLIYDKANFTTIPLTVARNGSTIESVADDFSLDIGQTRNEFVYDGSTWHVYSSIGPRGLTGTSAPSSVAYSIALG